MRCALLRTRAFLLQVCRIAAQRKREHFDNVLVSGSKVRASREHRDGEDAVTLAECSDPYPGKTAAQTADDVRDSQDRLLIQTPDMVGTAVAPQASGPVAPATCRDIRSCHGLSQAQSHLPRA